MIFVFPFDIRQELELGPSFPTRRSPASIDNFNGQVSHRADEDLAGLVVFLPLCIGLRGRGWMVGDGFVQRGIGLYQGVRFHTTTTRMNCSNLMKRRLSWSLG